MKVLLRLLGLLGVLLATGLAQAAPQPLSPLQQLGKSIPGGSKNTQYQVIVGSGGFPFDDAMSSDNPPREPVPLVNWQDRYYGWATVQVHRSGNVTLQVQFHRWGARQSASQPQGQYADEFPPDSLVSRSDAPAHPTRHGPSRVAVARPGSV